MKSLVRKLSFT